MKRDRLGYLLLRLVRFFCMAARHGEAYERSVQVPSCPRQGLVRQQRTFQSDPARSLEDDVMPGRQGRSRAFVRNVRTRFLSTQRRLMVCLSASRRSSNRELGLSRAGPGAHATREPESGPDHPSCRSAPKHDFTSNAMFTSLGRRPSTVSFGPSAIRICLTRCFRTH